MTIILEINNGALAGAESFEHLITEQINPETRDIDRMSTEDIAAAINRQDAGVHEAVAKEIPRIAMAVDMIAASLRQGGRLFYIGAGTSGRLGVLDASECPPTYGVDPGLVTGIIAGGDTALRNSVEGVEDDREAGMADIGASGAAKNDVVVGLTASGRAPYVLGALARAKELGCGTVGVCCCENTRLAELADICIAPIVGPEAVMGSTRMKAGTAQKMVLNILSTAAMIKLGKVYGNLMVDVQPKNHKLYDRAERITMLATGCDRETARANLDRTSYHAKSAIVMILTGCSREEALERLERNGGFVRECL